MTGDTEGRVLRFTGPVAQIRDALAGGGELHIPASLAPVIDIGALGDAEWVREMCWLTAGHGIAVSGTGATDPDLTPRVVRAPFGDA